MKRIIVLSALLVTYTFGFANEADMEKGKEVFKMRCASCHHPINKSVGPALHNVQDRHSVDWILDFVHSSQTMVKNGDPAAIAVFNENNQGIMPDHPDLKKEDIVNIIAYVNSEAEVLIAEKENTGIQRPVEVMGLDRPLVFGKDYWMFIVLGIALLVIYFVAAALINKVSTLRNMMHKDGGANDMEP